MHFRTGMMVVAMVATISSGCGSSEGETEGEASTGATAGSSEGGEEPTGGESSTGEAELSAADLVGSFASRGCESYPNGMGGNNYLTRAFTLTETTWHLDLVLYGDDACTAKLFTAVIDGPYTLVGPSPTVAGATDGEFGFSTIVWTAHMQAMADTFTMSGCGADAWEVEVPQDVTATGCIGVAHPVADCPKEFDVVALTGDELFFGERVSDMCVETGRPAALGSYPVVRM